AWHLGATGFVAVTVIVVALRRHFQRIPAYQLLHPYHIKEVAEVLQRITNAVPTSIRVEHTSHGIQLSFGHIETQNGCLYHYSLSQQIGDMDQGVAEVLAK